MYRKAHKGLVIKATESFNLETIVIDQYYCIIPSGIDNFELAFLVRHTYINSVRRLFSILVFPTYVFYLPEWLSNS